MLQLFNLCGCVEFIPIKFRVRCILNFDTIMRPAKYRHCTLILFANLFSDLNNRRCGFDGGDCCAAGGAAEAALSCELGGGGGGGGSCRCRCFPERADQIQETGEDDI